MNTRKIDFLVGLFVLVGFAAAAFLAIRVAGGHLAKRDAQTVSARFTNANGLKKGSPIRVSGVTVGEITDVQLKHDDMSALISFRVESGLKLDDDTSASVRSAGLIGEKFISLKPGASGTALKPGAVIVDTESAIDLEDLIAKFAFGSVDKK